MRHVSTLVHFASWNVLLAFDYDGTLAPLSRNPDRAHLRDRTRRLLIAVAQRYPCVVLSGRAREDVSRRLADVPVRAVFGNHGLDRTGEKPAYARLVRQWIRELDRRL